MYDMNAIQEAKQFIESKINIAPKAGLILGSGLGILADEIIEPVKIPYSEIPHFPVSTVEGHAGQFVFGNLSGKPVVAMQGRFHYYEGYSQQQVTFPIRVMKALGVETLLLTNAAGGVNTAFKPGDLMIITDHLNMSGMNPLIGKNMDDMGPRFPDMSEVYSKNLSSGIESVAERLSIPVQKGVYVIMSGPSYETPAEIRMLRTLGADAVGMSTVPEAIVANHCGMKVAGISCITNMAAGILDQPLNHTEVMETAEMVKVRFIQLVKEIVGKVL